MSLSRRGLFKFLGAGAAAAAAPALPAIPAVTTSLAPLAGHLLGADSLMWSDIYLATGVIHFQHGDVTITHAANELSLLPL